MDEYRHEYKYMINNIEESIIYIKAEGILDRDPYALLNGSYIVRSLYFDDYDNSCMLDNENGVGIRSKFRIRYYNNDNLNIQLEKKVKIQGMTQKVCCTLSLDEYYSLVQGNMSYIDSDVSKIKKNMFLEMQFRNLIPKNIVSYERIPFIYPAGNVRITFDRKITSSNDITHFLEGNYAVRRKR